MIKTALIDVKKDLQKHSKEADLATGAPIEKHIESKNIFKKDDIDWQVKFGKNEAFRNCTTNPQ